MNFVLHFSYKNGTGRNKAVRSRSESPAPNLYYMTHSASTVQEAGVGKTCLVHRFVTEKFDDKSIPTVG